jgi:hypothetical protein
MTESPLPVERERPASPSVPPGADPDVPAAARMYDYFLGGTLNFPADRAAGEQVRRAIPEVVDAAWANRAFHQRAARWLAEQGIRQFIDIGSGLPTAGNTHEVVQQVSPDIRVLYADHDPLVLTHSAALLADNQSTGFALADMRDADALLGDRELRELIDLSRPAGLLMTAVTHFLPPAPDPVEVVRRLVEPLAPGSYLALSQVTDENTPPRSVRLAEEMYARGRDNLYFRSRADVARFFDGLELVAPGEDTPAVVHVGQWGADDPALADSDGSRWLYCGVARKPEEGR